MDQSNFQLTDRVAIITGASGGIGRAISLTLARAGARLALAARRPEPLEAVATEARTLGVPVLVVPTDVTRSDQVHRLVERAREDFGRIDILVNNAGGTFSDTFTRGRLLDTTEHDWDETLALNLKSSFLCSQAVARVMLEQGRGVIINIASLAGQYPNPDFIAYGAAKAGLINLTRAMALDLAPHIRVNALSVGAVDTPRTATRRTPERWKALLDSIPLGVMGQPQDVAWAVLYLASDAARWVTGAILSVDGGAIGV